MSLSHTELTHGTLASKTKLTLVHACQLFDAKPLPDNLMTNHTHKKPTLPNIDELMGAIYYIVIRTFKNKLQWNPSQNSNNFIEENAFENICHLFSPQCVNTLRQRQNGRHFADDIFKYIFLNENVWILIKISLKFVPKGLMNNIPSLVQIMAWRRPGDKPLSELMMVSLLGFNVLNQMAINHHYDIQWMLCTWIHAVLFIWQTACEWLIIQWCNHRQSFLVSGFKCTIIFTSTGYSICNNHIH